MIITFKELRLRNFKNHRDLKIPLGSVTRIAGKNGEGKSTIGEAIAWCLYGVDLLGNDLTRTKELSPEPTTYEFDRVEATILLDVDGKEILLSRWIEEGEAKYFINETPTKKAAQYKDLISSLFDKNLFLSLFSPGYFFSQKWEEQRGLLLKNVQNPTAKEVLGHLPKPQADKLGELLKKQSIEDLDAKHRDNKNRKDKELIDAKAVHRTRREELELAKPLTADELIKLNKQIEKVETKIKAQLDKQNVDRENDLKEQSLKRELELLKAKANDLADKHKAADDRLKSLEENPPADECETCGQPLDEDALKKASESHEALKAQIAQEKLDLKEQYKIVSEDYKLLKGQLSEIPLPDHDPDELRILQDTRHQIADQIKSSEGKEHLSQSVEEARAKEKEIEASFKESVFVLDAIKAYLAKEAEIMADKVQGKFQTLKIQLFQENKGNGERKPFFEIYMKGKPYRKLSLGERYTAWMELSEVLSKEYNVIAPAFLDNAESFTGKIEIMGQAIICRAIPGQQFKIETEAVE